MNRDPSILPQPALMIESTRFARVAGLDIEGQSY